MKTRRSFLTVLLLAVPGFLLPRKAKATLPCGPVCAFLVVVIVLGVAVYLLVKTLKGCDKLKKNIDRMHPDEDEDLITPVSPPPSHASIQQPLNHNATAEDISDLGHTDPNGNVYCVVSDTHIQSADSVGGSWQSEGRVENFISFASAAAMQWSEATQCYPAIMSGAMLPQGLKTKFYNRDGVLVGTQFQAFHSGVMECPSVTISPTATASKKFFRARSAVA